MESDDKLSPMYQAEPHKSCQVHAKENGSALGVCLGKRGSVSKSPSRRLGKVHCRAESNAARCIRTLDDPGASLIATTM